MVADVIGALAFLTIFGRGRPPHRRQQPWFPVVGAGIGALVGLTWWGAVQWWSPGVAAAITLVADLVVTGLLHVDGLADAADGLLPHLDRQRRLDVMATPDIGAFALTAVVTALLLKWSALASLHLGGARTVAVVAGLWATSRGLMVVAMNILPYARTGGGLASAFLGSASVRRAGGLGALTLGIGGGLMMLGRGALGGAVATGAALLAGTGVLGLGRRRLGGYTGDVLGAAGVVAEVVGLLALAAQP